jgi:hypothetical protein
VTEPFESTEPTLPVPQQPDVAAALPPPAAPPPAALVPVEPPPVAPQAPPPASRPPIYPMITSFDETVTMSRLWGIPLLGVAIRGFLLIPHFIVLTFYAIVVALLQLVIWIPVLVNGRYPAWGYAIVGGFIRWVTRVQAYAILAAAAYPPLSTGGFHDVDVRWDESQAVARWAGIPLLGVWIRSLLLIPHLIILYFLGVAVWFLSFVTWVPVLISGRYGDWAYRIVGGYIRWQNRTLCYALLMTGPYPPFSLDD